MGGARSKALDEQLVALAIPHSLQLDLAKRLEQSQLLGKFKDDLYLCYEDCRFKPGLNYKHYFITDRNWTMEFLKEGVSIHCNPIKKGYVTEKSFKLTPEVRSRMEQLCGSLGYSLCLRNCEHLSRYVQSGSWVSLQMYPEGVLRKYFLRHMLAEHLAMINKSPEELKSNRELKKLYPAEQYSGFVEYEGSPSALSKKDEDAYNVVLIGPTGAGKSRIINLLFNNTVALSAATATSVTREITIYSGSAQVYGLKGHLNVRKVNVIDTIGLCDSDLSAESVLTLVKEHLKVNFMNVDRVVVVCANRVEHAHAQSIQNIMKWLRYKTYSDNFLFLYNKSDLQGEELRISNLGEMCSLLGVPADAQLMLMPEFKLPSECLPENSGNSSPLRHEGNRVCSPMAKATGFPDCDFPDVRDDVYEILDGIFCQIYDRSLRPCRLPVEPKWCTIL